MFLQKLKYISIFCLDVNLIIVSLFCFILISCETNNTDNTTAASAFALVANNSSTKDATSNTSDSSCTGNGPCKMFVPANQLNLGINLGISGLDNHCNNASDKPSGGGTYKAMVTTGNSRRACSTANCSGGTSEHINWVLKPNKEYRRFDGTTVVGTTNANGIFTFPLTNSPYHVVNFTDNIVTGMNSDWTNSSDNCSGWSGNTQSFAGGGYNNTSSNLINKGIYGCTTTTRALCVEQ